MIGECAIAGSDERCVHALELFAAIYGAEAANLTLKYLAIGGVYYVRRDRTKNPAVPAAWRALVAAALDKEPAAVDVGTIHYSGVAQSVGGADRRGVEGRHHDGEMNSGAASTGASSSDL